MINHLEIVTHTIAVNRPPGNRGCLPLETGLVARPAAPCLQWGQTQEESTRPTAARGVAAASARPPQPTMLSDKDIKAALAAGTIEVGPLEDPDIQIQPASIDLRLGNDFRVFKHAQRAYIDPLTDDLDTYTEVIHVEDGQAFILHPGEFVLGTIKEYVKIPDDIVAQVDGRSSLGRLAILVHATAGFIDPGFEGNITLELSNVGKMPVAFYPNMRVCQISFTPLSTPAEIPYGHPSRRSKYQGQRGPTASRIRKDN